MWRKLRNTPVRECTPVALHSISITTHLDSNNSRRCEQNSVSYGDSAATDPQYDPSPGHGSSVHTPPPARVKHDYKPLTGTNIRLILLRESDDETAMVEAELVHLPLAEAQDSNYIALSYCWGSCEPSAQIRLDERFFWVRPNVSEYLRKFRKLGLKFIWVSKS